MAEKWRSVADWEGIYEVSDLGRVRRVRRNVGATPGVMRGSVDRYGYPTVDLSDRGRRRNAKVHRLVADAFLGPLPAGMETRHLNGDPSDARLVNLAYGTHAQNMRDMVEHGRSALNKTHCPQGHPYNQANVWLDKRGARNCRKCRSAKALKWQHATIERRDAAGELFFRNVRRWGRANGFAVAETGRISNELLAAYRAGVAA